MIKHFLSSGRFITAIAYAFTKILHLGNNLTYILSFALAIISTSIAVYKLEEILNKDIKSKTVSVIASILIIINIFSIELYLFIEKGILMLSVLLCVLALEKLRDYFIGNKRALIGVFIYMLFANFSYQGTVGLFVALGLLYIVKYTKDIKSFVKNTIVTAFSYGIPAIVNYLIVRFAFYNDRVNGSINIIESIEKIIKDTKYMIISTYDIIPKYLFISICAVLLITAIYNIISSKMNFKKKKWLILGLIFIVVGNFVATIFPQIMQNTNSIWFVPRSTYTFASLIGIIIAYMFMNVDVNIKLEKVLIIGLMMYMVMTYISFTNIVRDRYILNYMDYYTNMQLQEKIKQYEEETNTKVTKIAFYTNEQRKYSYQNLYVNRDTNIKASYPEWSRLQSINYYLNRDFEEIAASNEIEKTYFKDKKWNFYDNNQVIILNDTVHLYIY